MYLGWNEIVRLYELSIRFDESDVGFEVSHG